MEKDTNDIKDIKTIKKDDVLRLSKSLYLNFVLKKSEKLVEVLYFITNVLNDKESVKWQIRKKGNELLSDIMSYRTNFYQRKNFARQGDLLKIKITVSEIISLLSVSFSAGIISKDNFKFLETEMLDFIDLISRKSTREDNGLDEDYFVLPKGSMLVSDEEIGDRAGVSASEEQIYILNNKDSLNSKGQSFLKDNRVFDMSFRKDLKDNEKNHKIQNVFVRGKMSTKDKINLGNTTLNNRAKDILAIIKKMREVSIKDISSQMKDCSEKTIQRELLSLIRSGRLSKTGEKRWSRYSIK